MPTRKSKLKIEETEDVTKLSNKELKEKLTSLGITTGPIVGKFDLKLVFPSCWLISMTHF